MVCRVNDFDLCCFKGCVLGLYVNLLWDVMEKLKKKEEVEYWVKWVLDYKDFNYLILKGFFFLNEESLNDEFVIDLKGF